MHNATTAWHEKRRVKHEAQAVPDAVASDAPVSAATTAATAATGIIDRAADLVEGLLGAAEQLSTAIATVGDPDAAARQIEATAAAAAGQMAEQAEQAEERAGLPQGWLTYCFGWFRSRVRSG